MYFFMNLNAFPAIRQFYSVTRNTLWHIADKDHILIFIRNGSCKITYSNEEYLLHPGDIFFVPRDHSYTRSSVSNTMCTMTYIHFSLPTETGQLEPSEIQNILSEAKQRMDDLFLNNTPLISDQNHIYLQNKFSLPNYAAVFRQLEDIQLFSNRRQLMCGLQSSIVLSSILSTLSQHTIEQISEENIINTPDSIPANLKKAIRYIRGHYAERISLDDLADECNVSKQQLIRYFRSAFQTTPVAYMTEYKIARAKDLLFNQPQLTIKEISDELGYNNQHYFTKVFIKSTGESPSEYRQRIASYLASTQSGKDP